MVKRFFTSDPHIGHARVAETRGFLSPMAHDKELAQLWDARVGRDDIVYVLGDIAMNPYSAKAFDWFRMRPGIKHLIAGNHDSVHPMHSKSTRDLTRFEWTNTFKTIQPFSRIKIGGQEVLLSHFPYEGEGERDGEDRYTQYRLRDEGMILIHGHTHSKSRVSVSSHGTLMIHVGVDAWGIPVDENELQGILDLQGTNLKVFSA